jgi:hypothetical protein
MSDKMSSTLRVEVRALAISLNIMMFSDSGAVFMSISVRLVEPMGKKADLLPPGIRGVDPLKSAGRKREPQRRVYRRRVLQ